MCFILERELWPRDFAAEPRHGNKRAGICIKQTIPAHKSISHKSFTLVLATEQPKGIVYLECFICFMRIFSPTQLFSLQLKMLKSQREKEASHTSERHGRLPNHKWLQFSCKISLANHRWIFTKNALKGLCHQ